MTKELASYLRGWKSYFGFCETPSAFNEAGSVDTSQVTIRDLEAVEKVAFRQVTRPGRGSRACLTNSPQCLRSMAAG